MYEETAHTPARTPARTRMSHYLRTGEKVGGFRPDSYKSHDPCDLCGGAIYDLNIKSIRSERNARYRALFEGYQAAKRSGKTHKIWQIAGGITTRQSHKDANGQKVGIDENFRVGGDALFLPGDPEASLSETANCRCSVEYVGGETGHACSIKKIIRTVINNRERIVLTGGRYVRVFAISNQPFFAPILMDIISYPLDANGNEITAFQNSRPTFGGHILPLIGNIYEFVEAGDRNYRHVLIVMPQTNASGADISVNVTLEVSNCPITG